MKFIAIISLLISLLLLGCSKKPSQNDVIGSYYINIPSSAGVLALYPNGTYQHKYKNENNQDEILSDSWEFEIIEGWPTVVLHDFKSNITGVDNFPRHGYFLLKATLAGNACRLLVDSDRGIYFEKISQK